MDPNLERAIDSAVAMTLGILNAAHEVSTIKSAVITSSVVAHYSPRPGKDISPLTADWDDEAIVAACKGDLRMIHAASKVWGERALWQWVEDNKVSQQPLSSH